MQIDWTCSNFFSDTSLSDDPSRSPDPIPRSYFCEKNMLAYFPRIMYQRTSQRIKVQLIQTLSIMILNMSAEHAIFYFLSNNHLNDLIVYKFDFSDEELLSYYISFLKTLSLKLNKFTLPFFFNERANDFPLYTEALKFFHHEESMVRAAVRTLTLNVFQVDDPGLRAFILNRSAVPYFSNLVWFVRDQCASLDALLATGTYLDLAKLSEQVEQRIDHFYYLEDIFQLNVDALSQALTDQLLCHFILPILLGALLDAPPASTAAVSSSSAASSGSEVSSGDALSSSSSSTASADGSDSRADHVAEGGGAASALALASTSGADGKSDGSGGGDELIAPRRLNFPLSPTAATAANIDAAAATDATAAAAMSSSSSSPDADSASSNTSTASSSASASAVGGADPAANAGVEAAPPAVANPPVDTAAKSTTATATTSAAAASPKIDFARAAADIAALLGGGVSSVPRSPSLSRGASSPSSAGASSSTASAPALAALSPAMLGPPAVPSHSSSSYSFSSSSAASAAQQQQQHAGRPPARHLRRSVALYLLSQVLTIFRTHTALVNACAAALMHPRPPVALERLVTHPMQHPVKDKLPLTEVRVCVCACVRVCVCAVRVRRRGRGSHDSKGVCVREVSDADMPEGRVGGGLR